MRIERELICHVCDARGVIMAQPHVWIKRCPECGSAADLVPFRRSGPFEKFLVWLTLISLCGLFWYAVVVWLTGGGQ